MTGFYSSTFAIAKNFIAITAALLLIVSLFKRYIPSATQGQIFQQIKDNTRQAFQKPPKEQIHYSNDKETEPNTPTQPAQHTSFLRRPIQETPTAGPSLAVKIFAKLPNGKVSTTTRLISAEMNTIIGRSQLCDIRIKNDYISNQQIKISYTENGYEYENISKSKRFFKGDDTEIAPGDKGKITRGLKLNLYGGVTLVFGTSQVALGCDNSIPHDAF